MYKPFTDEQLVESLRKGNEKSFMRSILLNSRSFIIYRHAEVLLSYTEAQNEAVGPGASVYTAINQIRTRSGLLPPVKTGLTQAEMRVAIQRERRAELAFEEFQTGSESKLLAISYPLSFFELFTLRQR